MEAAVMTDGDRRTKSNIGLIHQRYTVVVSGNSQKLKVFPIAFVFRSVFHQNQSWYRLKTRVDETEWGTVDSCQGMPKDKNQEWIFEIEHANAHRHGAPGFINVSSK